MKEETKEIMWKTGKKIIKNGVFILASSIPGIGKAVEAFELVKDSYDEVQLEEKLEEFSNKFDSIRENTITIDEEYEIKNVYGIEIFFEDYIEMCDGEFIDNIVDVLENINEKCTVHGEYGCVYENYVLSENSLQIIFEQGYKREDVDDYIQNIEEGISDGWHDRSPILKVKYY